MPIYSYKCCNCGFEKDFLQKISDQPIIECPQCKQQTMEKQLTAPGFKLNGIGWAATDFNSGHKSLPATSKK